MFVTPHCSGLAFTAIYGFFSDASDHVKGQKAPAEKIMTDGCGFINRAAALLIRQKLNLASRPTAVQGRIKGAKGLFVIHPTDTDPDPKIWIRKSQDKMSYLYPLDRGHRILDLLTVSHPSAPISLSRQSILNLAHNEIPDDVLIDLLIKGLTDEVKPLMNWGSPQAMIALWQAINRIGGVTGSRTQRQAAGRSRAIGLQGREWGHVDVGMEDEDAVSPDLADDLSTPVYSGRNDCSGGEFFPHWNSHCLSFILVPLAMHECAVELVQAGFRPDELKFLRDKIRYIVNQTITTTVEKYQIPLPLSTKAFIIPGMSSFPSLHVTITYKMLQTLLVFSRKARYFIDLLKKSLILRRIPCSMLSRVMCW
jgi:hypothetical protein